MTEKTKSEESLREELNRKIEENQDDYGSICKLLEIYVKSDSKTDVEKGLNMLRKYRGKFEHKPEIHRLASLLYMRMGGVESVKSLAIEATEKYAELDPENPLALTYLGYVYWKYGELEKAIAATENGKKIVDRQGNEFHRAYLNANLAYYYAEGEVWKSADVARKLAEEAYQYTKAPSHTDTYGYVLVKFARSPEDLDKAEALFQEALRNEHTYRDIIKKHQSLLREKRKEFSRK